MTVPEISAHRGLQDDESLTSPLLLGLGDSASAHQQQHQPSSSFLAPQTVIEQTIQPDGSIIIKASTMTPHINGYLDVKIDHYLIPASRVASVDTAPGAPQPSGEYLTRVEYRVLSPGLELEPPDDDASTVYTASAPHGDASSIVSSYTRRKSRKRRNSHRTLLLISGVCVFFIVIIGVAVVRDYSLKQEVSPKSSPDDASPDNTLPVTPEAPSVLPKKEEAMDDSDDEHGDKNATSPSLDPEHNSTDYDFFLEGSI